MVPTVANAAGTILLIDGLGQLQAPEPSNAKVVRKKFDRPLQPREVDLVERPV